jgi:hypothetical protein
MAVRLITDFAISGQHEFLPFPCISILTTEEEFIKIWAFQISCTEKIFLNCEPAYFHHLLLFLLVGVVVKGEFIMQQNSIHGCISHCKHYDYTVHKVWDPLQQVLIRV